MMDELLKKLEAKGKSKMSPEQVQAKLEVVQELLEMAQSAMADQTKSGLDEMMPKQSVEVMAPDQESLAEGLDVAKDMVESEEDEDMDLEVKEALDSEMDSNEPESDDEDDEDEEKKSAFPSLL